ncbi:hypothetical protein TVAG_412530 [Trichomonas vaginalis G3]|uniref:Uncharacterized protein n=1 Tax=Trichomonas vaginalis (strain ATCC PRA-98 / G3) TaxID=412133 RepID=A2EV66_TRIV3|nr:hypothetical protein TVAGG3_0936040 [Trichomonas vaginalis G3]EAY03449.1 hypothetical protein TVAG_412530 [Trichomonas vaginalis G3]KAI5486183.1 hypothetical protein TVAGG3_0936040 [Trichomonas vaginalis G3]|eukprot:XP_001315672.1 hypothetical protein [Trichomonas vaginalis G3]
MIGYNYLAHSEVLTPFLIFCRYFDDLGAVSTWQIVGQHIVSNLNMLLILSQAIATTVMILQRSNQEEENESLRIFREILGITYETNIDSIYSVKAIYTYLIIFVFSVVSMIIRLDQRKSRTILPMPSLLFNSFYNIISPIFVTCICIGFSSSLFNLIALDNINAIVILILSGLSAPAAIYGVIRVITDSRMEKLPYASPMIEISMGVFYYYIACIVGLIYVEYSNTERVSTLFLTIVLMVIGAIFMFQIFKFPIYHSPWHSLIARIVLGTVTACLGVICTSTSSKISIKKALTDIGITAITFAVIGTLHTYMSRWWVRRTLKRIEIVDPKNYSPQRLARFLCVADVRADQEKFANDFPEQVMNCFPDNQSLVVFSIVYKLYDINAHKDLLLFAQRLSMFNATNNYLSSILRSIIFVAQSSTLAKGKGISSALLSRCYKLEEQFWLHSIQNNRKMSQIVYLNLSKLVQRAKPFFERHNAVIGGIDAFLGNILFTKTNKLQNNYLPDGQEEEEKSENGLQLQEYFDVNDDYFSERMESISKYNPANYKLVRGLLITIIILIIFVCVLIYISVSHVDSFSYAKYNLVQNLYKIFAIIINSCSIPGYYYLHPVDNQTRAELVQYINDSYDFIYDIKAISNNATLFGKFENLKQLVQNATLAGTYVNNTNSSTELFGLLYWRGRVLFDSFSNYGQKGSSTLKRCLYCLTAAFFVFLILFLVAKFGMAKYYEFVGGQTMYFNKDFASMMKVRYEALTTIDIRLTEEQFKYKDSFWVFFIIAFLPFFISYAYCLDLYSVSSKFVQFNTNTLYISQIVPMIANNNLLLPQYLSNSTGLNNSLALESVRLTYSLITSLINSLYIHPVTYNYDNITNFEEDPNMINFTTIKEKELKQKLDIINKTIFSDFFNATTILLRDCYLLLSEENEENLDYVLKMLVPTTLSTVQSAKDLLYEFNFRLTFLGDSVLFTFIFAPILFILALFLMTIYVYMAIKRLDTSCDLVKRIISLPRLDNPFFDEANQFTGFKKLPKRLSSEIYSAFPMPTFQVTKEKKILHENEIACGVFGDIVGTDASILPQKVIDSTGHHHYFNYSWHFKKALPKSLHVDGNAVIISNDITSLVNKREMLKNLYKDIRLTFSIPTVLQREKPTHIQNVAIVNFCFSRDVTNEKFLNYSSKIEDFFSQFVSFFMFEKMRFSFYVLFYDPNASRQASRDAISFAQIARYEANNRQVECKIAVAMEEEVVAKAEKTDMIWSVKFPNAILWRTDAMFSQIDYGRIICLSKMSPGMHFTKSIHIGITNEQTEVITF